MTRNKKWLFGILVLLAAIQFIQPARNQSGRAAVASITAVRHVPDTVLRIFREACYDCHSNNTKYPWYARVQPTAWWLAHHVQEGKSELNFDEFAQYTPRRQAAKLKAIGSSVTDGTMPLRSYTLLHKRAVLTAQQRELVKRWADTATAR